MIKKLCIVILALLPFCAKAQQAVGSWVFHPTFSSVTKMVESEDKVYYLSSGSLFYFDKTTEENGQLGSTSGLNGVTISNIFYNPLQNYLLVCYSDGNMDKVFDSGKIVNLPDISNAVLTVSPEIKQVAFGKDAFYVLTNFGLVSYNDKKNEVRATAYTTDVESVMCIGDYVVAKIGNELRYAPLSERLTNTDKLATLTEVTTSGQTAKMVGTPEGRGYMADGQANNFMVWTVVPDFSARTATVKLVLNPADSKAVSTYDITANPDGTVTLPTKAALFRIDKGGAVTSTAIPAAIQGTAATAAGGAGSVWIAGTNGIGEYDLTSATPVTVREPFKGSPLSVGDIRHLTPGFDGSIIPCSRYYDCLVAWSFIMRDFHSSKIKDGKITDITPKANNIVKTPSNRTLRVVQSPVDPDTYYVAAYRTGILIFKNGEYTGVFNATNSPETTPVEICIDSTGALWAIYSGSNKVYFLPADKLNGDYTAVKKTDWVKTGISAELNWSTRAYACRKSNLILMHRVAGGDSPLTLTIYDTKGTADASDDQFITFDEMYDQDNNSLASVIASYAEDSDGNIFVGGENMVLNLGKPDISKYNKRQTFTRIKIPRNDGTNLADYLGDGSTVTGISIDSANNKWLATNSGAILVNASNDKILQQFTADNSPFPTTCVNDVAVDPNSNSVWFAFDNGVMEYSSTTSPGNSDYSEVIAYPNPVRPDYTGWITIKGLMNDSLVKIADASGNVVNQGRSNGGMYIWDGNNAAGERVATGVYYVYASQNATGSSSGAVTKILVVN